MIIDLLVTRPGDYKFARHEQIYNHVLNDYKRICTLKYIYRMTPRPRTARLRPRGPCIEGGKPQDATLPIPPTFLPPTLPPTLPYPTLPYPALPYPTLPYPALYMIQYIYMNILGCRV